MNTNGSDVTRIEYERRFVVSPRTSWMEKVEPYSKVLEDKYLSNTRLRLRLLIDSDTGRRLFKLNKKEESTSSYFRAVDRLLLSPAEYELFHAMEGHDIRKTRYYHHFDGRVFSIDVFEGELEGLVLCEVEANSLEALMDATPPEYAKQEVTEDSFFTGGNLCRTTRQELLRKLSTFN
jgi:CYTH domain-containing protein